MYSGRLVEELPSGDDPCGAVASLHGRSGGQPAELGAWGGGAVLDSRQRAASRAGGRRAARSIRAATCRAGRGALPRGGTCAPGDRHRPRRGLPFRGGNARLGAGAAGRARGGRPSVLTPGGAAEPVLEVEGLRQAVPCPAPLVGAKRCTALRGRVLRDREGPYAGAGGRVWVRQIDARAGSAAAVRGLGRADHGKWRRI